MRPLLCWQKWSNACHSMRNLNIRYYSQMCSRHPEYKKVTFVLINSRSISYNEKIAARGIVDSDYGTGFSEAGGLDNFGKVGDMEQFMVDDIPQFLTTVVPELQELSFSNCWPTVIIAHTFNNVQEITGLPWYATIFVVSILLKVSVYPFHIWWRKDFQEYVKSSPIQITTFLQTYFDNVLKVGPEEALRISYNARSNKCKELGLPLFPSLIPLYATISVPVMAFLGLSYLTHLTYEPFLSGGLFWFQNLSEPDPLFILPVMNSFLIIMNARFHPFGLLIPKPVFMLGLKEQAAFGILTISQLWFSSAILLYWITANSTGLFIQLLLRESSIRKYHGLESKVELFRPFLSHSHKFSLIGENIDRKRKELCEINETDTKFSLKDNDEKLIT